MVLANLATMASLLHSIAGLLDNIRVFAWDGGLAVINLVTPNLKEGHVTPEGQAGAKGLWPEYIAPKDTDSRCACPALNALANHGILPRDGRNITFKEMNIKVRQVYNFAPSFCYFVPNFSANMLKKNYAKDTFDLEELSLHNGIEHDGSLTREDSVHQPDQGKPHLPFVQEFLSSATGTTKDNQPLLTVADLAQFGAKRRVDAKRTNPSFTLSLFHRFFGSSNSSTLLTIFGGRVRDLEIILTEERLPEGWESRIRSRMGLTMAKFNMTAIRVEWNTVQKQKSIESDKKTM